MASWTTATVHKGSCYLADFSLPRMHTLKRLPIAKWKSFLVPNPRFRVILLQFGQLRLKKLECFPCVRLCSSLVSVTKASADGCARPHHKRHHTIIAFWLALEQGSRPVLGWQPLICLWLRAPHRRTSSASKERGCCVQHIVVVPLATVSHPHHAFWCPFDSSCVHILLWPLLWHTCFSRWVDSQAWFCFLDREDRVVGEKQATSVIGLVRYHRLMVLMLVLFLLALRTNVGDEHRRVYVVYRMWAQLHCCGIELCWQACRAIDRSRLLMHLFPNLCAEDVLPIL